MTFFKLIFVASGFFVVIFAKQLHLKHGNLEMKDKEESQIYMNLLNTEEFHSANERYARHIQAVTESALDVLLSELHKEYKIKKSNSPVRRLIRNITEELQRRIERQKKNKQLNKAGKVVQNKQKQKKPTDKKTKLDKKTTKKALRKLKYTK